MGKLTDGITSAPSNASLLEWCDVRNRGKLAERMHRWYYVNDNDGTKFIDCLEGDDGDNVRRLLDGKLADFEGWPQSRMQGYRNWLNQCAHRGLAA